MDNENKEQLAAQQPTVEQPAAEAAPKSNKTLIIILSAIIVVFAVIIAILTVGNNKSDTTDSSAVTDAAIVAETTEDDAEAEAEEPDKVIDYAAIYATHDPDEVVMTIDGNDITWSEYFYFYYYSANQISQYMDYYAAYGYDVSWDDALDEDGTTFAQEPAIEAESSVQQLIAIQGFAKENGIELNDENKEALETAREQNIASFGEDATEDTFIEYLSEQYLPYDLYNQMMEANYIYQQTFTDIYGQDGANVSDEDAIQWLEDNGYMSSNHILFMTVDTSTGEALSDEDIAAKKAQAEELAAELQGIKDEEKRLEKFLEYKEQYDEDTGKANYPNGYTFTEGTMVQVFEDTTKELDDYQVSDPVESSYGYHIIISLPLSADSIVEYSGTTAVTARAEKANEEYGQRMQEYYDNLKVEYADGFTAPLVTDYLVDEK